MIGHPTIRARRFLRGQKAVRIRICQPGRPNVYPFNPLPSVAGKKYLKKSEIRISNPAKRGTKQIQNPNVSMLQTNAYFKGLVILDSFFRHLYFEPLGLFLSSLNPSLQTTYFANLSEVLFAGD